MTDRFLFLLAACFILSPLLRAEEPKPPVPALWEIGVLGGVALTPDYPAAEQTHIRYLGVPYFIYRGNILRADQDGARARIYKHRRFNLEFSFAGSFAANADQNRARRGMEDLDWMGEVGPRLAIPITRIGKTGRLRLLLPVRGVFSTDFESVRHRGFTFTPGVGLYKTAFIFPSWTAIASVVGNFGNRQLSGYFYDVAPRDTLPDRAFYDARAGYMGTDFFTGFLVPWGKRLQIFVGGGMTYHGGSANEKSPLFRQETNFFSAVGLSWTLFESKRPAYTLE